MFALIHSIVAIRPTWVLLVREKLLQWIQALEVEKPRPAERALPLAGTSTQSRLQVLESKMTDSFIVEAGLACVIAVGFLLGRQAGSFWPHPIWMSIFALCGIAGFKSACRLAALKKERASLWLSFNGERVVGEELNGLTAHGYHVFHDLPLSETWNIDHIIVGPSGIYAVETKVEGIPERGFERGRNEVIYDGKGLRFPNHYDAKRLAQAKAQAERLEKSLSSSVGMLIDVKPVLTVPGWSIRYESSEQSKLVMSTKMLRSSILGDDEPIMSAEKIQRVVEALEQIYWEN